MRSQVIQIPANDWRLSHTDPEWIAGLESGKVLYFPQMPFTLREAERPLLDTAVLDASVRNISLGIDGRLKGVVGSEHTQEIMAEMVERFREHAETLVHSLAPKYQGALRRAPTSYRPAIVEGRKQSWRADDRRLHVDAFPSRPNYGERILRVFSNINPHGVDRVWRIGEPFESMAKAMLPRTRPYVRWQARALEALRITKSLRSEYDHLMLQLHDSMKADPEYQRQSRQLTMEFAPGSVWMCFSDQALHSVQSGQYMLEQTFHLAPEHQYDPSSSPLSQLTRLTGRQLV